MTLMLDLFVLLSLGELLVINRFLRPVQRPLAAGIAIGLALVSGGIIGQRLSLATTLVGVISMYRILNLLRVVKGRREPTYLRQAVRRTTLWLLTMQAALLASLALADAWQPSAHICWLVFSDVTVLGALVLALATKRSLRTTTPPAVSEHFSDARLPSISICIPARNETSSLESCLRSLTASDYPKLEIIVLDDCSQGSRTSDIIRAFAHDGVRFIQGELPPTGWLAKNWAYQQLFEAASGEYLVFCGVDTRWEPPALRNLVTTLLAKQKRMLSLMPVNSLPQGFVNQLSLLVQPMRYAWELCLPRRLVNRPPVLSTSWIIERKFIDHVGAFAAVRNTITPEAYFAKKALVRDNYGFVHASPELAVVSDKRLAEQWQTAIRTRYPQLRRRIELVVLISAIELSVVCSPLVLLIAGIIQNRWPQALLAALSLVLTGWSYGNIVRLAYARHLLYGYVLAPVAALLDVYLRHESLWRYEFGAVSWKGRNVCLPVMRVIPKLPKL